MVVNKGNATWDGARTQCKAMGGNLASIDSKYTQGLFHNAKMSMRNTQVGHVVENGHRKMRGPVWHLAFWTGVFQQCLQHLPYRLLSLCMTPLYLCRALAYVCPITEQQQKSFWSVFNYGYDPLCSCMHRLAGEG